MKNIQINKYCSEIDLTSLLEPDCINLMIASTGSGKTRAALSLSQLGHDVSFVAPFTGITNQVHNNFPSLELEVGVNADEKLNLAGGRITTFHSAAKLLELKNIDLLVIDEIHTLISYTFAVGLLTSFWDVVEKLKAKHPHMKILALTGTPQFVRLASFLDFNIINIDQKEATAKPDSLFVSRSWTKEYAKETNFITLYPSRKIGKNWASKHNGAYIDSKIKDSSDAYKAIVEGKMPRSKVFTSTLLATGVSITDPVDTIYTNWLYLQDIVQMSSRPRLGGHKLKVTQVKSPWFLKDGISRPDLNFTSDFERNFQLINEYATWYSWAAHQDEYDLHYIVNQMLWLPHHLLPELD